MQIRMSPEAMIPDCHLEQAAEVLPTDTRYTKKGTTANIVGSSVKEIKQQRLFSTTKTATMGQLPVEEEKLHPMAFFSIIEA